MSPAQRASIAAIYRCARGALRLAREQRALAAGLYQQRWSFPAHRMREALVRVATYRARIAEVRVEVERPVALHVTKWRARAGLWDYKVRVRSLGAVYVAYLLQEASVYDDRDPIAWVEVYLEGEALSQIHAGPERWRIERAAREAVIL